jgi:hypothetical protein
MAVSTNLHNILVGGAIFIVVAIGLIFSFTTLIELIFGGSNFRKLAKEMGAIKTGDNVYEVTVDGEQFAFGTGSSSYRIKSVRDYFFVACAFSGSGYLGFYDRRSEMYGARCHAEIPECFSGDAEFDRMFLIQAENAEFATAKLASASKRETLRRLRDAGFTEIQFNDDHNYPARKHYVCARIPHSDGDKLFGPEDATPSLIHRAAKMLRELEHV